MSHSFNFVKDYNIEIIGMPNEADKALPVKDPLPSNQHLAMFVGAPGSGKTSLAVSLLDKYYKRIFNNIWLFSASVWKLPKKFVKNLDPSKIFDSLDELEQVYSTIKASEEGNEKEIGNHLIIIDDLATELKVHAKTLQMIAANRRNSAKGICIWILTQSFMDTPIRVRNACDTLFVFKKTLTNAAEVTNLLDKFISGDKRQVMDLIDFIRHDNDPYSFLYWKGSGKGGRHEYYYKFISTDI